MNTRGNNLDDITLQLVDAILSDTYLQREKIIPRVRAIIKAWVVVQDRPQNYNKIKTDKGILQRTIEQRGVEKEFWRNKLKELIGAEQMKPLYEELERVLINQGYK